MQAPGAYRLRERIALHGELLGDLGDFQSLIEPFLRLLQHLCGQHCRPSPIRLLIKPRHPFVPIEFHGSFDADQRDSKGPGNLRLLSVAVDAKLSRDHAKGRNILFGMDKYRHVPVEVDYLAIPFFKSQFRRDVLDSIREKGQLHLRHRSNLSSALLGFGRRLASSTPRNRIVSKSYRRSKPLAGAPPIFAPKPSAHAGFAAGRAGTHSGEIRRSDLTAYDTADIGPS